MKLEKTSAPITRKNSIAVVRTALLSELYIMLKLSLPLNSAIRKAPEAPIPAASVGVKMPA
ncbi:hypothetical protein D9M71_531310 [compost metagenome]